MLTKNDLKYKDIYCTDFVIAQINALKKYFDIPNSKRVYALGWWNDRYYFLCRNKIYAVYFDYLDKDKRPPHKLVIHSVYIITLNNGTIADFEVIKPDDTTPKYRTVRNLKIDETRKILTKEFVEILYDSPARVNEYVNVPYKKAIEFLQNYKKTTFKTDRYLFYVKKDSDRAWLYFIYAYDLKTNAELKIYVDRFLKTDFPEKLSDIYVKDLSGKLSKYQILQCKKAFVKYCKQKCDELNAPNYYAYIVLKKMKLMEIKI